jgi:hypothetical protein
MFDLQQTAEVEGRASEAKVWSVLVVQIWTGLPGYCYGTPDLTKVSNIFSFTGVFVNVAIGSYGIIFSIAVSTGLQSNRASSAYSEGSQSDD